MKSNLSNINLARNMPAIRDSLEIMSDKQFSNINQPPKHIAQKNARRNNSSQPAQTFAQHSTAPSSTQRASKPHPGVRKDGAGNRTAVPTTPVNPKSKQTSDNAAARVYQWFIQCCRKKKDKLGQHRKKKRNCFKRWREKYRKRKDKKKTSFKRETSIIPRTEDAPVAVVPRRRHRKNGKVDKIERTKARRRSSESETGATPVRAFQRESAEELDKPEIDFTKSCCYLCAQNTMAIAAALSSNVEKLHISTQASAKEAFTSDKSCSPSINARTVKSSVKVKTRDMSTSSPDEKKCKRPKLKLKRLNILPKLKLAVSPKQRTVGCETDKSVRCKNMAKGQCKANRDFVCVKDANVEKEMDGK